MNLTLTDLSVRTDGAMAGQVSGWQPDPLSGSLFGGISTRTPDNQPCGILVELPFSLCLE